MKYVSIQIFQVSEKNKNCLAVTEDVHSTKSVVDLGGGGRGVQMQTPLAASDVFLRT